MLTLAQDCPSCHKYAQAVVVNGKGVFCPSCGQAWVEKIDAQNIFKSCPICQCTQFYLQKDFNPVLGCVIMLAGILLVPVTYGLSLVFFAAIDWLLHKRVPTMIVCYACGNEFRGFSVPEHFKPFMHHIGVKYDRKSNKKSNTILDKQKGLV